MLLKRKKAVDERVEKRTNELCAGLFPVVWAVSAVFLIVKLVCGVPFLIYALELLILAAGAGVWLIEEARFGTLPAGKKDAALRELSQKAKKDAFYTMFWIMVIGELVFVFAVDAAFPDGHYVLWVLTYIATWFPTCLWMTVKLISEGLMAFGSVSKEKLTKKTLAWRTLIGALVFGVFMGVSFCFRSGMFEPKGLCFIPVLAAAWGIPFYLIFIGIMKISEKRADRSVKEAELADEE